MPQLKNKSTKCDFLRADAVAAEHVSTLDPTAVAVIVAGNANSGTIRQIKVPRLTAARLRADLIIGGRLRKRTIFSATWREFEQLHLVVPEDVERPEWNCAFSIYVPLMGPDDLTVHHVRPLFIHKHVDLRPSDLAEAIALALNEGAPIFVGRVVTAGELACALNTVRQHDKEAQ